MRKTHKQHGSGDRVCQRKTDPSSPPSLTATHNRPKYIRRICKSCICWGSCLAGAAHFPTVLSAPALPCQALSACTAHSVLHSVSGQSPKRSESKRTLPSHLGSSLPSMISRCNAAYCSNGSTGQKEGTRRLPSMESLSSSDTSTSARKRRPFSASRLAPAAPAAPAAAAAVSRAAAGGVLVGAGFCCRELCRGRRRFRGWC